MSSLVQTSVYYTSEKIRSLTLAKSAKSHLFKIFYANFCVKTITLL